MLLRSGFYYLFANELGAPLYKIKIDFKEASRRWRENKIYLGVGMYCYK